MPLGSPHLNKQTNKPTTPQQNSFVHKGHSLRWKTGNARSEEQCKGKRCKWSTNPQRKAHGGEDGVSAWSTDTHTHWEPARVPGWGQQERMCQCWDVNVGSSGHHV